MWSSKELAMGAYTPLQITQKICPHIYARVLIFSDACFANKKEPAVCKARISPAVDCMGFIQPRAASARSSASWRDFAALLASATIDAHVGIGRCGHGTGSTIHSTAGGAHCLRQPVNNVCLFLELLHPIIEMSRFNYGPINSIYMALT